MKPYPLLFAGLLFLGACKKHGSSNPNAGTSPTTHSFFKDNVINENVKGSQTFQHALGYYSLGSDASTQIMVASRGWSEHNDAAGFRIAAINKTNGSVNWVRSYELPDAYYLQMATCAAMDKSENVYVAGQCYQGTAAAIGAFLLKLDNKGNILWSKAFTNYLGLRAYSLQVLGNGDLALLTKSHGALIVHRLTADGQPVWSFEAICKPNLPIDDDFYDSQNGILSPEYHGLVEASDGSIFAAASGNGPLNGVGGTDHLIRLDANGNLLFAKSYTLSNNTGIVRPVQLLAFGTGQVLIADQAAVYAPGPSPFFTLISLDGAIQASRGVPLNTNSQNALNINEVNAFQGNIYLSTCGGYQFNTYVLDAGLNLKSSVKTAAALDIGTDRGGIALFDGSDLALYDVLNFGGNYGESNGFEVLRNDGKGTPCINTYTEAPAALTLENKQIMVASDTLFTFSAGPAATFTTLTWQPAPVSVASALNVCGL